MRFITAQNIAAGQRLGQDLMMDNKMLLRKGYILTRQNIERIKASGMPGVYIDDELSMGIQIRSFIDFKIIEHSRKNVKALFSNIENGNDKSKYKIPVALQSVLTSSTCIVDECLESLNEVINVVDLKTYDGYLYQHSTNVAILSTIIGAAMNMTRDELLDLSKGAILHDIGKLFIDKKLINKPATLTPEEYEIVKKHPKLGYDYLEGFWDIHAVSRMISMLHHERVDGSGYPLGYTGNKIHDFAKIVCIADVYDALTSDRPYKKAYPPHKALAYINENVDTMFDARIAEFFFSRIAPYPLGTCVLLNDGTTWIVVDQNRDALDRPILKSIENGRQTDIRLDLLGEDSAIFIADIFNPLG